MKPWNPYAMTFHGQPITGQTPPKLVVYGPPLTAQQGAMLQVAYNAFSEDARLSIAKNPSRHGLLRDGSRYAIYCTDGVCTCVVWPRDAGDSTRDRKRGFVAVLDFLKGHTQGEFKATLQRIPGARLLWREGGSWVVKDKKFRTGDSYLSYKPVASSVKLREAANDASKIKTDLPGHADVLLSRGGLAYINTVETGYKVPGGVPLLLGGGSGGRLAYGVTNDRVIGIDKNGNEVIAASTLDEKEKLTALATVFMEAFDCTRDMRTVSFFGTGNDLTSWHHWGVRADLNDSGDVGATTEAVKSRTWPGEVALNAEGAAFVTTSVEEWSGLASDEEPDGHIGYHYTWTQVGERDGFAVLNYTGETEYKQTPISRGNTDIDTYDVSRNAGKSIRAGFLNGSDLTIDMNTSLTFSYRGENGSGTWYTTWPGPMHNLPGEVHAAYFYGGGWTPGTGTEYSDGSNGQSKKREYSSKSTAVCTVGGASVMPLSDVTITQSFYSYDDSAVIVTRRAASAEGQEQLADMGSAAIGHAAYSFAGGNLGHEVGRTNYTRAESKEEWKVVATTRDYIYHCEQDKVSVLIRSEFVFDQDSSSVVVYVEVIGSGVSASKVIHSQRVDVAGMYPCVPLRVQINNTWYCAVVVPPTPVFAPVACEQGAFKYIAHATSEESSGSESGLLLALPLQLYFRIKDYMPPTPPRALSFYPIQMAKVWEAFGYISLHSLPFDLDKKVHYIQHDGRALTQWTQPLVSDADGDPEKASAEIYRT